MGDGTRIDDYCTVRGRVEIGPGNWIYPYCTIGTGPQHSAHLEDPEADPAESPARGSITIGSGNIIREYSTVHLPAVDESTSIGSRCHVLSYSHIAHDCAVGDSVTMANGTTLGGHSSVEGGANLGFNVSVHPYCRIGAYAMVAMMMPVVKDVLPYALVNRQRLAGVNEEGMKRAGMTASDMADVRARVREARPAGRRWGQVRRRAAAVRQGIQEGLLPAGDRGRRRGRLVGRAVGLAGASAALQGSGSRARAPYAGACALAGSAADGCNAAQGRWRPARGERVL